MNFQNDITVNNDITAVGKLQGASLTVTGLSTGAYTSTLVENSGIIYKRDLTLSLLPTGTEGQLLYNNADTWTAFSGLFWDDTNNRHGINVSSSLAASLHVRGAGTTSSTFNGRFEDSAGTEIFRIRDDGLVSIRQRAPDATYGSELITNGAFTTDLSGWTVGGPDWYWASAKAEHAATGATTLSQLSATIGQHYRVKFTILKTSGTNIAVSFGGVTLVTFTSNTTSGYVYDVIPTTTAGFVATPTSNFVGTIDSVSVVQYSAAASPNLVFYGTNGTTVAGAVRFSNTTNNIAIGEDIATKFGVDSTNNIGIGYQALGVGYQVANTVAIGTTAGKNVNNTSGNVFIGYAAAASATSGSTNTAVGSSAMTSATTGGSNTAVGGAALRAVGTGNYNVSIGAYSLYNATGSNNTVVGYYSGFYITSGTGHVLVGTQAGLALVSGTNNTAIGYQALYNPNGATGANTAVGFRSLFGVASNAFTNNTAVGYNTGVALTTGSNNVLIGYNTGANITSGANNLVVGYNLSAQSATTSNQMTIGNALFGTTISGTGTTVSPGFLGVFVTAPTAKLHLPAGTTTANTAPLKFTSGVNLTAAEAGAVEWDGTNLYITQTSGPTRKTIAYTDSVAALTISNDTTTNAVMYPTWVTATSGNIPLKVASTTFSITPAAKSLAISTTAPTSSVVSSYELAPALVVGSLSDTYGRWSHIPGLVAGIPNHGTSHDTWGHSANLLTHWTFRGGTLTGSASNAGVTLWELDGTHTEYRSTGTNDLPLQELQYSWINSNGVYSAVVVTYDFDTALNGVNYQKLHERVTNYENYRPVVGWKAQAIGLPTNIKVTISYSSDGTATTSTVYTDVVVFDAAPTWYGERWVGPVTSLGGSANNWIRRVKFEFTLPTTTNASNQGRIFYLGLLTNYQTSLDTPGLACRNRWYYSQNYRNGAALRWEADASAGPWTAKDHIWGGSNNLYVYAPQSGGAIQLGWDKSGTATNTITGVYESSTHKFRPANVSENVQLGDATYMWNGGFFGGALDITRPASNASIYQRVAGEAEARMALYDSKLEFGSGAATREVVLQRTAANMLSLYGSCFHISNSSSGGHNYTMQVTRTYVANSGEKAMVYAGPVYTQVEASVSDIQQVFRANPVFSYTASNPTGNYIFTSYSRFTGNGGTSAAAASFYSGGDISTGHTVNSFTHFQATNVTGTGTWGTINGFYVADQPAATTIYGFRSAIVSGASKYSIHTGTALSYFQGVIQSTVATGTAPFTIASTTLCDNLNAELWDSSARNTYTASTRSNTVITGGGTIAVSALAELYWSQRMIVIANGRGSWFSTTGYFDITVPTAGTTITAVGGGTDQTVTAAGIPVTNGSNYWCALYYILPIGSGSASVAANFRLVSYTVDFEVPEHWVCIARRNPDSGLIHLAVGPTMRLGETVYTGTTSSINPPYFGGQAASYYLNTSATAQTKTGNLTVNQLTSTVATGTAPLVVSSTTTVANLSCTYLQGMTWTSTLANSASAAFGGAIWDGGPDQRWEHTQPAGEYAFTLRHSDAVGVNAGEGGALWFMFGDTISTGAGSPIGNISYFMMDKNGSFTAGRFVSNVAIGTSPLTVTSTSLCTNLNSDLLDSQHGSYYTAANNHILPTTLTYSYAAAVSPFAHYLGTIGDNLAFRTISNQEYWDFASPGWVASSADDVQSLLTGRVGLSYINIPPARRKFRFTVPIDTYLGAFFLAVHQQYNTTGSHQVTVTLETGPTSSGAWTTYINGVSSPAGESNYHFYTHSVHNTSDTWARITVESADSTNNTSYCNIRLLFSYTRYGLLASPPMPFTWNWKREMTIPAKTTFSAQPTIQLSQPSLVLRQTGDANNHRWIDVNNNTFRILKTNDAYDSWVTQLAITSAGFIGLGNNTSTPTHALHVSTTAANLALFEGTRSDGPVYLWMTNLNTPSVSWGFGMRADGGFEVHRNGGGAVMSFGTSSFDVQINSQVQINAIQGLRIHGTVARQYWYDTDGTADSRLWDLAVSGDAWYYRLVNDAQSVTQVWLSVIRSGLTVSSINFTASSVMVNNAEIATQSWVGSNYATAGHTHGNITSAGAIGSTANLPLITTTSGVVTVGSFGNTANTFCQGNDSRLSDARTPTSHAHGNITNAGYLGSTANVPLITGTAGIVQAGSFGSSAATFCEGNDARLSDARTPTSHSHGSITNTGYLGSTANVPLITGTAGVIQAGSFGNTANTFCQGNDSRLSDARTPTTHTHSNISVSTQYSITGGGDLSANRTLNLVNDVASPGTSYYYGTNGAGTRGWYSLPVYGYGTVTSVGLSAPAEVSVANSPVTTSGTLALTWANQTANKVFASPNGSTGTPSFRTLVAADIPALSYASTSHTHGNITNTGYIGAQANLPLITGTGGLVGTGYFGSSAATFCEGNDSRLSDARTPTSHSHGNISNAGAIGSTSNLPVITGLSGVLTTGSFGSTSGTFCQGNDSRLSDDRYPTPHTHGNITNGGYVTGAGTGVPLVTGTSGIIQAGSFGTTSGTVCQGNDSRFSGAYIANGYTMNTARLLGRTTASSGAAEEISLANGSNCSATLSGGTLTIAISSSPTFTNCTVTGSLNLPTSQPSAVNGTCYWDGSTNKFWVYSSTYGWKSVTLT